MNQLSWLQSYAYIIADSLHRSSDRISLRLIVIGVFLDETVSETLFGRMAAVIEERFSHQPASTKTPVEYFMHDSEGANAGWF